MNAKELKGAMKNKDNIYGTLISTGHPKWPEIIKQAALDFVFIDTEHESIDRAQLAWMCQAFRNLEITPIVRIPSPDPFQATMALDAGAKGIIAPYVETVEQVNMLRGAVKYHPLKGEVLQDVLRGKHDVEETLRYLIDRNEHNMLLLNIESGPAIDNLDDLLCVPDVDGILIGPHDLSCNLGIPEQYRHPTFNQAVNSIMERGKSYDVGVGIISGIKDWNGLEDLLHWDKQEGMNIFVHGSDIVSFSEYLTEQFTILKSK